MALNGGDIVAGKYAIEKLLGEGGMGSVYIATNNVLQKKVALKVMSEKFASVPAAVARFHREAIAASKVSHPSIVQVFDAGQHDGKPWIAMELLDGESLGERLERGPMGLEEILHMALGALSALAEVHEQGIVHRDLKPDNIFLATARGGGFTPKVLDFGVAKDTSDNQLSKLTATGAVVGTAYYLSPEQAKGLADIDARADVYAMGVVLFESISGHMPYEADTITQLIAKMFTEPPQPLLQVAPSVPTPIADIIGTCLEQDRNQRFQTARSLLGALESAMQVLGASPPAMGRAPTALAASNPGTWQGAHDPQRPGQAPQPSAGPAATPYPASSQPGMNGSHPGTPVSHPGTSQPGMHGSHGTPGSYPGTSQPGMHGSHPGAPGSYPGTSQPDTPGSQPGDDGSRPGIPHTAAAVAQPAYAQTQFLADTGDGSMPGSVAALPPAPESRSKLGLVLGLGVFFFLALGAGGAFLFLQSQGDSGDAVASAHAPAEPDTSAPTEAVPEPEAPSETETAEPPAGVDATDETTDETTPAADETTAEEPSENEPEEHHATTRRRRPQAEEEPPPAVGPSAPVGQVGAAEPVHQLGAGEASAPLRPIHRPPPRPSRPPAGLAPGQVQAAVNTMLPHMERRCYLRRARRVPGLQGTLLISWTVGPRGRARGARVVRNGTGDEWLGRCALQIVQATRFPPASNGLSTPARYPFTFSQ